MEPLSVDEMNTESERMLSATDVKTGPLDEERIGTPATAVAGETASETILPGLTENEVIVETGSLDEKRLEFS